MGLKRRSPLFTLNVIGQPMPICWFLPVTKFLKAFLSLSRNLLFSICFLKNLLMLLAFVPCPAVKATFSRSRTRLYTIKPLRKLRSTWCHQPLRSPVIFISKQIVECTFGHLKACQDNISRISVSFGEVLIRNFFQYLVVGHRLVGFYTSVCSGRFHHQEPLFLQPECVCFTDLIQGRSLASANGSSISSAIILCLQNVNKAATMGIAQ